MRLVAALALLTLLDPASAHAQKTGAAPKLTENLLTWTPAQQQYGYAHMNLAFPTRVISRGAGPPSPPLPAATRDLSKLSFDVGGKAATTAEFIEHNKVAGILVLQDGRVVWEHHAFGHTPQTKWTSFSVSKSLTSMLVGAAIRDGAIRSVDDPVVAYLPVLRGSAYEGVTIRQVLHMSSGVAWNEDYTDPESDVGQIGAVTRKGGAIGLVKYMAQLKRAAAPDEKFNYSTGEAYLIGAIVSAAVGNNLSTYAADKLWSRYPMEADGYWVTTGPFGNELGGCCLSATLRDYGRVGMFALANGVLPDGTAVLADDWIEQSTTPAPTFPGYGYQWWLFGEGSFGGRGIFGQAIQIFAPEMIVIVTHSFAPAATGKEYSAYSRGFFEAVRAALKR